MKVALNCFRGDGRPGDIVDLPAEEAAPLLHHGAVLPVDEDAETGDAAAAQPPAVVRGAAALQSASGAADGKP